MSIDWFTFFAQIVNFLILIWLLKRFLYGPIIRAMAEREKQIASRFADADAAQARADDRERDYKNKLQELKRLKETMIARAGQDVEAWRSEQLQQARAEVEAERSQWQLEVDREKHTLLRDLQIDVAHHALELGRHILSELADQRLQTRLVDRFLDRLAEFDGSLLTETRTADDRQPLIVETSHDLTDHDRTRITAALKVSGSGVVFRTNPQLICGIELQSPDCRFSWNIRESLAELESDLIDAFEETLPGLGSPTFHGSVRQPSKATAS